MDRVQLEVWGATGVTQIELEGERVTLGRDPANLVPSAEDLTISALHAVLERYGSGWVVRDLGSLNGTFVNGERVTGDHSLHSGDELLIGNTRMIFRDLTRRASPAGRTAARTTLRRPELTPRERDVLHALCRPLLSSDPFKQPASTKAIAQELVVTEAAVKQHLLHLYAKFNLDESAENRRLQLANAAIVRGILNVEELRNERQG
jgi:pSer/pThr/pTyr-binding forkhead associated (FHA) protein